MQGLTAHQNTLALRRRAGPRHPGEREEDRNRVIAIGTTAALTQSGKSASLSANRSLCEDSAGGRLARYPQYRLTFDQERARRRCDQTVYVFQLS